MKVFSILYTKFLKVLIKCGKSIDPSVKTFITGRMDSKSHPEQAYKACEGVLGFEVLAMPHSCLYCPVMR